MPFTPYRTDDASAELENVEIEVSTERFDRMAFARHAVDLVRPRRTTVAFCEGHLRVRVEGGRQWGKGDDARWAIVSVPQTASRRAIALAVATLMHTSEVPYALDVLLEDALL